MRYTLSSKTLSLEQIEMEVRKVGGKNIKRAPLTGYIFCELDSDQATRLSRSGIDLKPVKEYRAAPQGPASAPAGTLHRGYRVAQQALAQAPAETLHEVFYRVRSFFSPPLSGTGLTVAVLDSGIRDSHLSLQSKVVYSKNFTDSPTAKDVFGHGTQVAFLVCGGMHAAGTKAGVSPGARVMNLKVINDEGIGTDEDVILGIDEVCSLALEARLLGKPATDDMYPNVIKMRGNQNSSLGEES